MHDNLLTCFLKECETQFAFLTQHHGFTHIAGQCEYKKGRQIIRPFAEGQASRHIRVISRFEKGPLAFEAVYSTEDYFVKCHMYYDFFYKVALEHVLQAAKRSGKLDILKRPAVQTDYIKKILKEIAQLIHMHHGLLLDVRPRTIERAITIHEKMLEHSIREQFKRTLKHVREKAAKAFTEKNYRRVIELLYPYEDHLSASDLKKLARARHHLTG